MSRVPSNALRIAGNTLNSPFIGTSSIYFYDQLKTNIQYFKAIELLEKQIAFPTTSISNKKNAFQSGNNHGTPYRQDQEFLLQTNLLPLNNVLRAKHFFSVQLTNSKYYFKNKLITGAKQLAPITFFSVSKQTKTNLKKNLHFESHIDQAPYREKGSLLAFSWKHDYNAFELIKQLCFSSRFAASSILEAQNQKLSKNTKNYSFFTSKYVLVHNKFTFVVPGAGEVLRSKKNEAKEQQNNDFTKKKAKFQNKTFLKQTFKTNEQSFLKVNFFAEKMRQLQMLNKCKNKIFTLFQSLFKVKQNNQFIKYFEKQLGLKKDKPKKVKQNYLVQRKISESWTKYVKSSYDKTSFLFYKNKTYRKTNHGSYLSKTNLFMLACVKNLSAKQHVGQTLINRPQIISVAKEAYERLKTPLTKSDVNSSLWQLQALDPHVQNNQQLQTLSYVPISKMHLKKQMHRSPSKKTVIWNKRNFANKKNIKHLTFTKLQTCSGQKLSCVAEKDVCLDNVVFKSYVSERTTPTAKILISRTFNYKCGLHTFSLINGRLNKSLNAKKNKLKTNCFSRTTLNYNKTYFWHRNVALTKSKNALLFNLFYTGPTDIEPFNNFNTKKSNKKAYQTSVFQANAGVMLRKTLSIRL